ncbi:hypothetical protein [Coleofasciculus sp. FACHB-129]|uniref:hypothetical protein n=1 Tax=Cyanophyceae TaxID=3028117 RepID=UPI001681D909|nr:hypothetical protein [Coleofasciculus sp. FACHB-129]MBD1893898.1 hypothetical protein [Coleofasciculus sp. FACHB-129]
MSDRLTIADCDCTKAYIQLKPSYAIAHGQLANLLLEFFQGHGGTPTYAGV